MDEREEAAHVEAAIGGVAVAVGRHLRELVEADQDGVGAAPGTCDVGARDVVGDPVDPGAQRAATVEARQAVPHLGVDVLLEVAAALGVGLVGAGEPGDGRAEGSDGLVEDVPTRRCQRDIAVGLCRRGMRGHWRR